VDSAYKFRFCCRTEEYHGEMNDLANRRSLRADREKGKDKEEAGVCITRENVKISCSESSQDLSNFPSVKSSLKEMQRAWKWRKENNGI